MVSYGRSVAAAALALACSCDRAPAPATSPAGAPAIPRPDLKRVADAPLRDALLAAQTRIEQHGTNVEAWSAYGTLLATHDLRREAADAFAGAEALDPKNFRWPYLQGFELAPLDVGAALAAYERALALDANYAPGHVSCGKLLLELARYDDAIERFERAVRLDEKSLDGWLGLGQAKLLAHAPDAALAALQRALALDADHPEVHSALANVCFALGRTAESQEHARIAKEKARRVFANDPRAELKSEPLTANDHVDAALHHLEAGRFDEAEPYLRKALDIDPTSAVAWANLAAVLVHRNDFANAEKAVRESIRIAPSSKGEFTLASILFQTGRKTEAADHAVAAAKLAPADAELHEKTGSLLSELGRFDDASKMFAVVVAARPQDDVARARLAVTLRSLAVDQLHHGLAVDGIATMRRAHAAKPDHVQIEHDLALLLATITIDELRDGAEAVKLAEHVNQERENNATMIDALAAAYAEVGRFDDAVHAIERAIAAIRSADKPGDPRPFELRLSLYQSKRPLRLPPEAIH